MKKTISTLIILIFLASFISSNIAYAIKTSSTNEISISTIKTNSDEYDMIIITPDEFCDTLEKFVTHKNNHGISTLVVALDKIYSGFYFETEGRDNPEVIKYFIKNAIKEWSIDYVLFVGSSKKVPVRFCFNNDNFSNFPELRFVSELYYADIYDEGGEFSSWDSDNDGIIGEWNGEFPEDFDIDLKPDIGFGRLACQNKEEVQIVTDKIISYENSPADASWFKRMVVVGGDTYRKFEGYEGEECNQRALDEMDGFAPVKLWASTGSLDKNGLSIIREFNKGCGFIYFSGHGDTNLWATYTSDSEMIGMFDKNKMKLLFNADKLPVCIVGGCHNSQFTVNLHRIIRLIKTRTPNPTPITINGCWSWELVKNPNGGSIATIGSTGLGWYSAEYGGAGSDWLNVQFFREYNDNVHTLGDVWKNSISKFIDENPINWDTPAGDIDSIDAKSVQQWTLLGDPSLMIGGY